MVRFAKLPYFANYEISVGVKSRLKNQIIVGWDKFNSTNTKAWGAPCT
jgi:hypothetical protein